MAHKTMTKKTSYEISGEVFNLTHKDGALWQIESPPLTFRPQNHLLEGARTRSVSFLTFLIFKFCFWSSVLIHF